MAGGLFGLGAVTGTPPVDNWDRPSKGDALGSQHAGPWGMNVRRLIALALALMTACACQGNQERTPNTAPSVSRAAVSGSSTAPVLEVSNEMLRHEVIGLSLRDAVARADLTGAERLARQLASADRERSGLSSSASKFPDYTERLEAMRAAAKAMESESASGDVKRAGAALGAVAKTCGDCHARLVGPTRVEVATREGRCGRRGADAAPCVGRQRAVERNRRQLRGPMA